MNARLCECVCGTVCAYLVMCPSAGGNILLSNTMLIDKFHMECWHRGIINWQCRKIPPVQYRTCLSRVHTATCKLNHKNVWIIISFTKMYNTSESIFDKLLQYNKYVVNFFSTLIQTINRVAVNWIWSMKW